MTSHRQSRQRERRREIERVTSRARHLADDLFGGDIAKGFLFWAAEQHLQQTENAPTQDELLENITDGRDDLELDAYYVDESSQAIYLFQSKYRSGPANIAMGDLVNFLDVPKRLTSPTILSDVVNQAILEFAPLFRRCVLDNYEIRLVYLTTLRSTQPVRSRANAWGEDVLTLEVGTSEIDVPHSAEIVDIDNFIQIINSLDQTREIGLSLRIQNNGYHQTSAGNFKCLIATLPLNVLAETFDNYRFAMFKHNPRGPLGSVAVNKEIRETLTDPTMRDWFQIMNNGLSAVCASFTDPYRVDDETLVDVRDLQIVNGCQTTFTVWDQWRRLGDLGEASVTLKLVEASTSFHKHRISAASNKQSQMKDWDFLFDEPEQQRLQGDFAALTPNIFYELRRGEHRYEAGGEPSTKVTIKDIAQANWAFVGFPGEAKDRLREIPRSKDQATGAYREVFYSGVEAERLRLPWIVYKRIQEDWNQYVARTGERGDFRAHGRLHILWLVGLGLIRKERVEHYRNMRLSRIDELYHSIDEWFPDLHEIAIESIEYIVDVERGISQGQGRPLSLRQLFRSSFYYEKFTSRHEGRIQDLIARLRGESTAA